MMRRAVSVTVALGLCACGGLTTFDPGPSLEDAARKVGTSHRALALVNDPELTIVTFDNPANPERIETPLPSMGYRAFDVEWSFDGRRLAAATTDKDVGYGAYFAFSSENWTQPERVAGGVSYFRWLEDDQYLALYADHLSLGRVGDNLSSIASTTESRLLTWSGKDGPSYLVQDGTDYHWFHAGRDPVYVQSKDPVSVLLTRDTDKLVVGYLGDNAPEASDPGNFWAIRVVPQSGCTPGDGSHDCLPRILGAETVPGSDLVILYVMTRGAEGSWHSILSLPFGSDIILAPGALEPGVIQAWGPERAQTCGWQVLIDRTWILCRDLAENIERFERLELTPDGLSSAYSTNLAPVYDGFRSPFAIDSAIVGHEPNMDQSYPEEWRTFDLRNDQVDWQPVGFRGELIMPLGHSGAIFIDTLGDPEDLSLPCAPCSFTAVKDILDPASPTLTGTFNAPFAPVSWNWKRTFFSAPDGSGVLTLENGVLLYENFAAPGVRFPIAEVAKDSSIHLPPTWGN